MLSSQLESVTDNHVTQVNTGLVLQGTISRRRYDLFDAELVDCFLVCRPKGKKGHRGE